jgi:hypothetical protein
MPRQISANQSISLDGLFTQARFLEQLSCHEIERQFGFAPGQLADGWWLLLMERIPSPSDFESLGYSYMSGGGSQGHLRPGRSVGEQQAELGGRDVFGLKQRTIRQRFRLTGPDRPAKVLAADGGRSTMPYRPARSIPQWKLVRALPFRVWGFIGPGQVYRGSV